MKKRTISKLKSIFSSKLKAKRHAQHSAKVSRTPSPEASSAPSHAGDGYRAAGRSPTLSRVGPPPSPPVPTSPVAPVAPDPSGPLALHPCGVCGRTFLQESLAKHTKICEKTASKKRKTFDSSRQRREGTDLEQYLPKNFGLPENSPFLEKSPPQTAKPAVRQKCQVVKTTVAKAAADLQKCPHCHRAFGLRAFERHVEWCADKAKILPSAPAQPPAHIADAKQRLNARTQYKAPPIRGRRSSQTRDKSSNSRSASVESSRGVSPPPRDHGDYKNGRTRVSVSESISSNECHEDTTPHMPVIRNTRGKQNNSSGDAVKARQARLARDLSSSRLKQSTKSSPIQESPIDQNIKKLSTQKRKLPLKKQQQLKKLEIISQKYNEQLQNQTVKDEDRTRKDLNNNKLSKARRKEITHSNEKSGIPVPKVALNKIVDKRIENNKRLNDLNNAKTSAKEINSQVIDAKLNKITIIKSGKGNCFSEESTHSVGTNTDMLCPCVPCVLHNDAETKKSCKTKIIKTNTLPNKSEKLSKSLNSDYGTKVELLFKNPTIVSSCDIQIISNIENDDIDEIGQGIGTGAQCLMLTQNDNVLQKSVSDEKFNENDFNDIDHLSAEDLEGNFEPDGFQDNFDDSLQDNCVNCNLNYDNEEDNEHDSGNTYTKFTEDPNNLEEFINITDKLIKSHNYADDYLVESELYLSLHTPNTNSMETLKKDSTDDNKHIFSDTLTGVKEQLQELLTESKIEYKTSSNIDSNKNESENKGENVSSKMLSENIEDNNVIRQVSDMEHITIYQKEEQSKADCNVTLPSITKSNRPSSNITCTKKKVQQIFKSNRKYKMLNDLNKSNRNFQTFIVKECADDSASEGQSICSEAPPLKLPRIETKRVDDSYDPFLLAARQMKELMSSDTNIPKKTQLNTKDSNRTLPILRPFKEKPASVYSRTENTKTMKDTLNKTYQKTPTLQRMKSFGSTHNDNNNVFGGRCSSFRLNRNDNKSNSKLNTTFTKSSKENIRATEKSNFNRNNSLNRSFSSYTASSYSTPKPRDKIPKISNSMYHSFQRTTIKQPVKLDKIKNHSNNNEFVNLDSILTNDNSLLTDSNYIDPRLINEHDNLPINVNTILNNPDMIRSMDSLVTTENLPAKFDSFSSNANINSYVCNKSQIISDDTNKSAVPTIDDLSAQYDKIMCSLEQSIASKTSVRDDDSLCEDFDLEEFMTSFDEELHKQKTTENKRTCSSTTRIVKHHIINQVDSNKTSEINNDISSPKEVNGLIPINKSNSFNFSSNNIVNETFFPSSMKRSNSNLLESLQKKSVHKEENGDYRLRNQKTEQLEQDIMQSLKDIDKFCETDKMDSYSKKSVMHQNQGHNNKRESHIKADKNRRHDDITNGNYTPNGKQSSDSAYSSLNRISPSKMTICMPNPSNGIASLEKIPAGSDSGSTHRENELRSMSSEEFLAMERSAELDAPLRRGPQEPVPSYNKEVESYKIEEKRTSSRASSHRSNVHRSRHDLSSSGSETSLHRHRKEMTTLRLSRFCHECGSKFPVDTAKFCIECGAKRLAV